MNRLVQHETADDVSWPVTMRFGTVLLTCVLLAFSAGHSLPANIAALCYLFGLCGLAFYFCLELVANRRSQQRPRSASSAASHRLARHLRKEKAVDTSDRTRVSAEHTTGDIECAMDSKADLTIYLGPNTQPTLSV